MYIMQNHNDVSDITNRIDDVLKSGSELDV